MEEKGITQREPMAANTPSSIRGGKQTEGMGTT